MEIENTNFDIAIYGSGLSSLFILDELKSTKLNIVIIESGDNKASRNFDTIDMVTGPFKFSSSENSERIKAFFGSCYAWRKKGVGGKLQKFDHDDFLINPWPFDYNFINKYYNTALNKISKILKIDLNSNNKFEKNNSFIEIFRNDFDFKFISTSLTYNFQKLYKYMNDLVKNNRNIKYYDNIHLLDFKADNERGLIEYGRCLNKNRKLIKIKAKAHVLSCGCLESNRIILNSFKNVDKFNKSINIGKKLTFHPTMKFGSFPIHNHVKLSYIKNFFDPKKNLIILNPKKKKKINTALSFVINIYRSKNFLLNKTYYKFHNFVKSLDFSMLFEHKPSINNQVSLSNQKSEDGNNKININTEVLSNDLEQIESDYLEYAKYFNNYKIFNKFSFSFFDKEINFETNNHHHGGLLIGTEKTDPVNENFLLRGFNNLFVSGASTFPSSSIYGPALTIVAMSILVSEKIKKFFSKN